MRSILYHRLSGTIRARTWPALAVALSFGIGACDSTGAGPEAPGAPPELPPASSMAVDFSLFGSGGGADVGFETRLHFTTAAVSVGLAQLATVLHLAVPTAVFAAAANNTPSFEEDGRWHWRYTASDAGQLWTAHLSGSVVGSEVVWDMRITSPQHSPALDEFLWYGGSSRTDRSRGNWYFNDPARAPSAVQLATLDWTHESAFIHGVTITATGGPGAGDILTADHNGSERLVTWSDASTGGTVEISWDVSTGAGYIIATNYNGGVKSCWDGLQNDVPCV